MSRRYSARIARFVAGVLLLVAAGRFVFIQSTEVFAEYRRAAKQPEMYVSPPWEETAWRSALLLASVPLLLFCAIRLIRRASRRDGRSPSSFSLAADCAGLYCLISFLQYLIVPSSMDPTRTYSGFLDPLAALASSPIPFWFSTLGAASGAYSGLAVAALFLPPANHHRALAPIAISAVSTSAVFAYVLSPALARFRPRDPDVDLWFFMLIPPVSAFLGAAVFRLRSEDVIYSR
jgi:hypothetical protein